jgi:hypothetical protein
VSILDFNGKEERASETRLAGKRIQVEPFWLRRQTPLCSGLALLAVELDIVNAFNR